MNPRISVLAIVILLALAGLFFVHAYVYDEQQDTGLSRMQKEAIVSGYIEENISRLSPEPEALGGTFYVTNIAFSGNDSGTVEYEDGHIALVADFAYSIDEEGAIEVDLTNARENRP